MKNHKKYITGFLMTFIGFIGGGLFGIATAVNALVDATYYIGGSEKLSSPVQAITLFVLLVIGVVGLILILLETYKKKTEE